MAIRQIDEAHLLALHAEGKNHSDIANIMGIPRSTVRDRLNKLARLSLGADTSTESGHVVYAETPPHTTVSDNAVPMSRPDGDNLTVLAEMVVWWQERKAALAKAQDGNRATERTTFHVEKRWLNAIRRLADLDGLTHTHIVNEAFRHYFER
jgi:hypothetical protein